MLNEVSIGAQHRMLLPTPFFTNSGNRFWFDRCHIVICFDQIVRCWVVWGTVAKSQHSLLPKKNQDSLNLNIPLSYLSAARAPYSWCMFLISFVTKCVPHQRTLHSRSSKRSWCGSQAPACSARILAFIMTLLIGRPVATTSSCWIPFSVFGVASTSVRSPRKLF